MQSRPAADRAKSKHCGSYRRLRQRTHGLCRRGPLSTNAWDGASSAQYGGSVTAGWNAENHLVVGRNVKPGQQIQLAIFGINGPLSNPPTNFIYLRYAKLEFYKGSIGPVAMTPSEVNVEVVRNDSAIDEVVGPNPKVFKL